MIGAARSKGTGSGADRAPVGGAKPRPVVRHRPLRRSRERGVVLIFVLIVLLILTIGAVALVRSMSNSQFTAGNLAFRRDLVNQGELAATTVLTEFKSGGALAAESVTNASAINLNYSAIALPTNTQGVPTALLNHPNYLGVGTDANTLPGATPDVTITYVIDRLCSALGPPTSAFCVQSSAAPPGGTATFTEATLPPPTATVYRLSVRVSGPRSTQVFLQSTFTKAD